MLGKECHNRKKSNKYYVLLNQTELLNVIVVNCYYLLQGTMSALVVSTNEIVLTNKTPVDASIDCIRRTILLLLCLIYNKNFAKSGSSALFKCIKSPFLKAFITTFMKCFIFNNQKSEFFLIFTGKIKLKLKSKTLKWTYNLTF